MLSFLCAGCGQRLRVKDDLAGKTGKCPACGQALTIPLPVAIPVHRMAEKRGEPGDGTSLGDARTLPPQAGPPGDTLGGAAVAGHPELTDFLTPAQERGELGRLGGYRVLEILGAGGMGVVFRAEDPTLKRQVALKAMLPGLVASGTAKQRFIREAQAAAALKHPNIVTIHQVGEHQGAPFLAMEYLEGEPLDKRLQRLGKLPVAEVLRIGRQIAQGLAAAHAKGLMHRDVKPANIWLEGKEGHVKILDFGLARAAQAETRLTQMGAILGTPAYMAPEQAEGREVDQRCDLFSLGVVLYRACTGRLPFQGKDTVSTLVAVATSQPPAPHGINPEIPPALSALVMRLLAKKATDRPATAEAVAAQLASLERDLAEVTAREEKRSTPAGQPGATHSGSRRLLRPWLVGSAVGLLAALVLLSVMVFRGSTKASTVAVEIDQPGAEISLDGNRITIPRPGQTEPVQIEVAEGSHELKVTKGGFETFTKQFSVKAGATETIRVRLEARAVPLQDAKLPLPRGTAKDPAATKKGAAFEYALNDEKVWDLSQLEKTFTIESRSFDPEEHAISFMVITKRKWTPQERQKDAIIWGAFGAGGINGDSPVKVVFYNKHEEPSFVLTGPKTVYKSIRVGNRYETFPGGTVPGGITRVATKLTAKQEEEGLLRFRIRLDLNNVAAQGKEAASARFYYPEPK